MGKKNYYLAAVIPPTTDNAAMELWYSDPIGVYCLDIPASEAMFDLVDVVACCGS
jgi:hypothetical protein